MTKKRDANDITREEGPDALREAFDQAAAAASIPFVITNQMKQRLRRLGYTTEEIAELTPQEAHDILGGANGSNAHDALGDEPPPHDGDIHHDPGTVDGAPIVPDPFEEMARRIEPSPFLWRDPETFPRRQWLYDQHYVRKYLTGTIATTGTGKTSLVVVETLAMATMRPLLGVAPAERLRVWYVGEDPKEEIERRVIAAMLQHDVKPAEVEGHLFIDSLREMKVIIAVQERDGLKIAVPVVEAVISKIQSCRIDVLIVDPFVKTHRVPENANSEMDSVAEIYSEIAERTGCAIELLHHPRKVGAGNLVTVEDSRGASSIISAARSVRTINKMTSHEASDAGLDPDAAWQYVRLDTGKRNMAPPQAARWLKLESVDVNRESVQAVVPWSWPNLTEKYTSDEGALGRVQAELDQGGPWRSDTQADRWAGIPIAKALNLDLGVARNVATVKQLIKKWVKEGSLKKVQLKDEDRKSRPCIVPGKRLKLIVRGSTPPGTPCCICNKVGTKNNRVVELQVGQELLQAHNDCATKKFAPP